MGKKHQTYLTFLCRKLINTLIKGLSPKIVSKYAAVEKLAPSISLMPTCFSTNNRHSYKNQQCSTFSRLVPLFIRGKFHSRASQKKI